MFKKKLDIIIDIESVDVIAPQWHMGDWNRSIFNVGITAVERTSRKVIMSKEIGIDKIWSVPYRFIRDYYRKNFTRADFHMMFVDFGAFTTYFNELLNDYSKEYDIELWSYNAMFDSSAFAENAHREGVTLHRATKSWKCIMMLAAYYLSTKAQVHFVNWTVETAHFLYVNGAGKEKVLEYITPIGNVRTTAQNVYRYLTDNPDFIELHKGLADTECEKDILHWCQGHVGWTKVDASPGVGWRLVNDEFVMGGKGRESRGHLLETSSLTITNLAKVNELIDFIKAVSVNE